MKIEMPKRYDYKSFAYSAFRSRDCTDWLWLSVSTDLAIAAPSQIQAHTLGTTKIL